MEEVVVEVEDGEIIVVSSSGAFAFVLLHCFFFFSKICLKVQPDTECCLSIDSKLVCRTAPALLFC